jgi:hypothetical protein
MSDDRAGVLLDELERLASSAQILLVRYRNQD